MADYTQTPQGGYAPHVHPEYAVAQGSSIGKLTNLTGAVVSLALVVGVGVWGYKLLVRDVSGIPVVRAAAGDMRVRPEEPGGDFAQHQGLSVNTIAAVGSSDERAEELHLAPEPIALAEEDQPMPEIEDAAMFDTPEADTPSGDDILAALESGSVEDLVAQLTQGVTPMDAVDAESVPVLASVEVQAMPQSASGLRVSLRPSLRPKRANRAAAATPAVASASTATEMDAASLPTGTRLVQLGAFDSPEIARAQWGKLNSRFAPFMEGKQRIVMEAKSGGRTFYRLRAHGFEDIGDARRFCSALVAESVDCIPVVTR
ncbi:SPOR domain-containing protein [Sulfitobacter sp.]|uniref:SPOR domain-containing protein n=1 Tax=Sulfitobacter sp. TaxID=1903071 RepID=UPI0030010F1C